MILKNTKVGGFIRYELSWIHLINPVFVLTTLLVLNKIILCFSMVFLDFEDTNLCISHDKLTFKTGTCEAEEELSASNEGCIIICFQFTASVI